MYTYLGSLGGLLGHGLDVEGAAGQEGGRHSLLGMTSVAEIVFILPSSH